VGIGHTIDYSPRLHERFEECESEKPLRDCHPDEEEEQAGCKPEFEAKVLLGNLRLWRPRVASWNLLCMHHRPPAQQMQFMVALAKDRPSHATYAIRLATYTISLMYINCPRVCPARKVINSFRTSVWGFPRLRYVDYIRHFPKPIGHAGGYCGRGLERLMYPSEIVIKEMERHRVRMVFHLFAE